MKFCAVGDVIIGRRIQNDFAGFEELCPIIEQADARLFNLETTLNREGECYASQVSGGTYLRTDPDLLSDFVVRCERFGTKLVRNADGSYDCKWN